MACWEKIMKGKNNMFKEIKINQAAVNLNAEAISGATWYLEAVALNPADHQSTITANAKGQENYTGTQQTKQNFCDAMKQEASNIKSLGVTFSDRDRALAKQWECNLSQK